jgi:hypothetical protein
MKKILILTVVMGMALFILPQAAKAQSGNNSNVNTPPMLNIISVPTSQTTNGTGTNGTGTNGTGTNGSSIQTGNPPPPPPPPTLVRVVQTLSLSLESIDYPSLFRQSIASSFVNSLNINATRISWVYVGPVRSSL